MKMIRVAFCFVFAAVLGAQNPPGRYANTRPAAYPEQTLACMNFWANPTARRLWDIGVQLRCSEMGNRRCASALRRDANDSY